MGCIKLVKTSGELVNDHSAVWVQEGDPSDLLWRERGYVPETEEAPKPAPKKRGRPRKKA